MHANVQPAGRCRLFVRHPARPHVFRSPVLCQAYLLILTIVMLSLLVAVLTTAHAEVRGRARVVGTITLRRRLDTVLWTMAHTRTQTRTRLTRSALTVSGIEITQLSETLRFAATKQTTCCSKTRMNETINASRYRLRKVLFYQCLVVFGCARSPLSNPPPCPNFCSPTASTLALGYGCALASFRVLYAHALACSHFYTQQNGRELLSGD